MYIFRSQQVGLASRHKINMMLTSLLKRCKFCMRTQQKIDVTHTGTGFVFRMGKNSGLILPPLYSLDIFSSEAQSEFYV